MLAAAHLAELVDGHMLHAEHGPGAAVAAGLQLRQGLHVLQGQQLRCDGAVHLQGGFRLAGVGELPGQVGDAVTELVDAVAADGEARGQLVAAVALQQAGQGAEAGEEVEAPVGPGGGLAPLAVHADQEGGAGVFLGHAGGHDAHHALVPVFSGQHDGPGHFGAQAGDGVAVDVGFYGLPLPVQAAQGAGLSRGVGGIVGQEQLGGDLHPAHAARGVDARRQHIAHGGGCHVLEVAAALVQQGGDAHALGMAELLQAPGHEGAVLPLQVHHVGDGAQADQVAVVLQHPVLVAGQGGGQLEGHTHAGQVGVGIGAVGPVGVDDGAGLGQLLLALVVVGDDEIDAQFFAQRRLGGGGDAAVHRDDQADLLPVQLADGRLVEAVALLEPAGDIADAPASPAAQEVHQQAGGGDAVHVVVAVDGDLLAPGQGGADTRDGAIHFPQRKGIAEGLITAQRFPRGLGGAIAAAAQHPRRQGRKARCAQRLHVLGCAA